MALETLTTMPERRPPLDTEKLGRKALMDGFRDPPGFRGGIARSTLLVGTRGSGKTMLLRRFRHTQGKGAIYGDLRKILNAVSNDTGAGGLTFDTIPASLETAIVGKTMALLSHWILDQVSSRKVPYYSDLLLRVLPARLREEAPSSGGIRDWARTSLFSSDLEEFRGRGNVAALQDLASDVAERMYDKLGPLVLLLDRAEEVPFPCLVPIIATLDQNNPFLTVVATRPGILGPRAEIGSALPVAGDHYDVRHLGYRPYSSEWQLFQASVLESWIPRSVAAIPEAELHELLCVSRDSIRAALELVHSSINDKGEFDRSGSVAAVKRLQNQLLYTIQGLLSHLNANVSGFLRGVRISFGEGFRLPLRLEASGKKRPYLVTNRPHSELTKDEMFARIGLRAGLFTTEHGTAWHPYAEYGALEVHPLYVWEENDKWWITPHTN